MCGRRSITVEMQNGKKMLELKITGNFYRAEKLTLYHEQDNLPVGKGERLGSMGVTPEFDTGSFPWTLRGTASLPVRGKSDRGRRPVYL